MSRLCSERLQQVQTPIIPIVASLIRQSPGTVSLGQGVVGYGPPPEAIAQITEFLGNPENHKYKPVHGIPALVEAIRQKLAEENQIETAPDQIFVTAGGNQAFANALLAIADPGDEIILQVPYYFNHEMAVTMASCQPVLVPTDKNYQLQLELVQRAISPRTKAVVTVSPNNPSGAVYPAEALRAVNELCRERGVYHIHDEAYEYFTYDGEKHFSPGALPGASGHTLSLYSLSKAYGFASWRIGYMVAPAHLVEAINKIQDTLLICAPAISQYAALGALHAGRAYCGEKLRGIEQVRKIVLNRLASLSDICVTPEVSGAFYFLIRVLTDQTPLALVEKLIREYKIAAIPGTAFGLEDRCYLRVAYGSLSQDTAATALDRLTSGLRALV